MRVGEPVTTSSSEPSQEKEMTALEIKVLRLLVPPTPHNHLTDEQWHSAMLDLSVNLCVINVISIERHLFLSWYCGCEEDREVYWCWDQRMWTKHCVVT